MMKIFNRRPRGASVRLLMEYIARVRDVDIEKDEPPLEMHLSDGTVIQGSEKVKELFKDWEMDFEYGTLGSGEKKAPPRKPTLCLVLIQNLKIIKKSWLVPRQRLIYCGVGQGMSMGFLCTLMEQNRMYTLF